MSLLDVGRPSLTDTEEVLAEADEEHVEHALDPLLHEERLHAAVRGKGLALRA
ncbi:MAG: hypothetical protein U0353_17350 [Sandaracinus sp.]